MNLCRVFLFLANQAPQENFQMFSLCLIYWPVVQPTTTEPLVHNYSLQTLMTSSCWSRISLRHTDVFSEHMWHDASPHFTCRSIWFDTKTCRNWQRDIKLNSTPSVHKYQKYSRLETRTKVLCFQLNAAGWRVLHHQEPLNTWRTVNNDT